MLHQKTRKEAYRLIEEWCANNLGADSTIGLMRLVLSLYNGRTWSYSIPVCIWHLDDKRLQWAEFIILDYLKHGESEELFELARKFAPMVKEFHWPPDGPQEQE